MVTLRRKSDKCQTHLRVHFLLDTFSKLDYIFCAIYDCNGFRTFVERRFHTIMRTYFFLVHPYSRTTIIVLAILVYLTLF